MGKILLKSLAGNLYNAYFDHNAFGTLQLPSFL